jgi:hypothetical protein
MLSVIESKILALLHLVSSTIILFAVALCGAYFYCYGNCHFVK